MFYWFQRGNQSLRYEVRQVSPTLYELNVVGPDGRETVERFDDSQALHGRQLALERELAAQGWVGPHGWNM